MYADGISADFVSLAKKLVGANTNLREASFLKELRDRLHRESDEEASVLFNDLSFGPNADGAAAIQAAKNYVAELELLENRK